jgi:tetratricopeptide (TPR) repeat protein
MSTSLDHLLVKRPNPTHGLAVFVHGFTGEKTATWGKFPELIENDGQLQDFDFLFWGYPTDVNFLNTVTRYGWSDIPTIPVVGQALRTLLDNQAGAYDRLALVGHSMGGLAIQAFVLGELNRGRRDHLDRLTEILLYGTPSGGLKKAGWWVKYVNTQARDMAISGEFIATLRSQWATVVDGHRTKPDRLARFKLTLVAGIKDQFVPQSSSLDPFPLDEQEVVPGNHIEMVKPDSAAALCYTLLRSRLLRKTPTFKEAPHLAAGDPAVVAGISRVHAADLLGDVTDLLAQAAGALVKSPPEAPLVERELGLVLLGHEKYDEAAKLLTRYVDFVGDAGARPFEHDTRAVQQLAIALSGKGDNLAAVERLNALGAQSAVDPETQGILAGRFKRQWLAKPDADQVGRRALELYKDALQTARENGDFDQVVYNGINAAYLTFALDGAGYEEPAREVITAHGRMESKPDYWAEASRAEALLLLKQYDDAGKAYDAARRFDHQPRWWTTTGQQARDILARLGHPPAAAPIAARFAARPP